MIITTTMHIENKPVQEYKGIVFAGSRRRP